MHMNKNILSEIISKVIDKYVLKEAMDDTFNFAELSNIDNYSGRVRYCKEHLGFPIGNGSSRIVFQLDDERCLKLAKNEKGIAQNEVENDKYVEDTYGVTPKIFNYDEDNKWLVSEYVLPAKAKDFKVCLGITFKEFQQFVIFSYNTYQHRSKRYPCDMDENRFEELCENNEWLNNLYYYIADYQLPFGDIIYKGNLGMVMRDGSPEIVILDSGLTDEVYKTYYS